MMAMRPIERGAAPPAFTNYREAHPHLVSRLGDYCSYCERQIETNLAVEHVQPKDPIPALRNEWANFLLGCVNCNSNKGHATVALAHYLWPDSDNTLAAFEYMNGGIIAPCAALEPHLRGKAEATLRLVGLDRDPGNPNAARRPTSSDQRWLRRFEAWEKAEWCRKLLGENDSSEVRELIVEVAKGRGMFSIFWTVFVGDIDLRRRLREAFVGTSFACFDANENVQPRPGGQC
jgi:uncharacterized protein (TIGR02646 family)